MTLKEDHRNRRLLLFGFAVVALLAALVVAVPAVLRALPDRYAYYLPEFLQDWRREEHPDTLPTPIPRQTPDGGAPAPSPTLLAETATPSPSPSPATLPISHTLTGLAHEPQWWNNCGAATLGTCLSFWGFELTQGDIAPLLKPDPEDKHIDVTEVVAYVRTLGMEAVARVGGDLALLKRLVLAGFPVMVETWYVEAPNDQYGHYRLVVGYDDSGQSFVLQDSLDGPDLEISYQELDELWRVYNRVYIVIYPQERVADLGAVLGPSWDEKAAVRAALDVARAEAGLSVPSCVAYADCANWVSFSWFNVGTGNVLLGEFGEAAVAYDQALSLGLPRRMLWYQFGPYQAYYELGRYDDVIRLADATLAQANLEESYYWRGRARLALGDVDGARADFQAALHYHEGWAPAQEQLAELE
jgi:hypothetical protein